MKLTTIFLLGAALSSLFLTSNPAHAQGSLTPTGAPAPTFKTLAQIEPRTPVDDANAPGDSSSLFIINRSGSFYLPTNIVGVSGRYGIQIFAANVTLDLNGFTMLGASNSFDGIVVFSSGTNATIRNGTVIGWGTGNYGIRCLAMNATIERMNVSGNSFGIYCTSGSAVRDCVINGNQRDGLNVSGSGALVLNNNLAGNNAIGGFGNTGISVYGSNNRIEGNHVSGNGVGFGLLISAGPNTNNVVIRNSVGGTGVNNYSFAPGNITGPLSTGTGTITNSNPWANFSY